MVQNTSGHLPGASPAPEGFGEIGEEGASSGHLGGAGRGLGQVWGRGSSGFMGTSVFSLLVWPKRTSALCPPPSPAQP